MDIEPGTKLVLRPPYEDEIDHEPVTGTFVEVEEDMIVVQRDGGMRITNVTLVADEAAADTEPWGSWVAWPAES